MLEQRNRLIKLLDEAMSIADEIYDEDKKYTKEEQIIMDCCAVAQQLRDLAYHGEDVIPCVLSGPETPRITFNKEYAYQTAEDINRKRSLYIYKVTEGKLL